MCSASGTKGKKTKHTLRATGVTHMYEGDVPEKIIQLCTGHHSVEALHT